MTGETLSVGGDPASAGTALIAVDATPSVRPLKIKALTLCDFRAFAGPEPVRIELKGNNLLIYGENGAGKSSIFHALDELFSVARAEATAREGRFVELKNLFSDPAIFDGFVEVEFDDGRPVARWNRDRHPVDIGDPSTSGAADERIVLGAYRKAILDYRSLLNTNYRHADGQINLFDVCVHVLLRDYPTLLNGKERPLVDRWQELNAYLTFGQIRDRQKADIAECAGSFNAALHEALELLLPRINGLVLELGWGDIHVSGLSTHGVTYNQASQRAQRGFNGQEVAIELKFRGKLLERPQAFLNEARLSALALAVYFAGRHVCASTLQMATPRLMVLDDVLIGLDQSNRLPVLQVLDKHFRDWQIMLLTHDRVWFEMARFHLEERKDWSTLELFEEIEPTGGSRPVLRPQNADAVASNIATARKFHALHEYAAAAVHARVSFELAMKKLCDKQSIAVRFHLDQRRLSSDELLTAIEGWLKAQSRATEKAALDPYIASVKMWRKVVLNPFSHSTPINLTSNEVIGAIDAVEQLHQAFKNHIR